MLDLSQTTEIIDAIILPLLGGIALFMSKFRRGDAARMAERQFMAVLVVISLVTLRTVIYCDEVWLIHTLSLGTLVVAALLIPGHRSDVSAAV